MEFIDTLSRFVHVGTAITVVGGTIFLRFVLMPAAEKLAPEAHEMLRKNLLNTWKFFVHTGIVLFIASGLYNYLAVSIPQHRGDSLYHMLIGIKILLAFIVFFLASVLVGRMQVFEKMRQNRKTWLLVIVVLAILIVLISSFLKIRGAPLQAAVQDDQAQTEIPPPELRYHSSVAFTDVASNARHNSSSS